MLEESFDWDVNVIIEDGAEQGGEGLIVQGDENFGMNEGGVGFNDVDFDNDLNVGEVGMNEDNVVVDGLVGGEGEIKKKKKRNRKKSVARKLKERALKNHCFYCREIGHVIKSCPISLEDNRKGVPNLRKAVN